MNHKTLNMGIPRESASAQIGIKYLLVTQVANDDGIVNLSHEDVGIQPFGK